MSVLFACMNVYIKMCAVIYIPYHPGEYQRITIDLVSPAIFMWVQEKELMSPGLYNKHFYLPSHAAGYIHYL